MLDLVVIDGRARGIVTRNLITGKVETHLAEAVVLGTGGYGNVYYLSTNAKGSNATAIWRAHKRGALFANPCFTQIHPTCIPVSGEYQSKLTLMSESCCATTAACGFRSRRATSGPPARFPKPSATIIWNASTPASATWCRAMWLRATPSRFATKAAGVGESGLAVFLDFRDPIERLGKSVIKERYGNLFDMYERITGEDPYAVPMRIFPAIHYAMGGLLWVDYNLMSNVPGLYVIGEANFSDHRRQPSGRKRADAGPGRRLLRPPQHHQRLHRRFQAGEGGWRPHRRPRRPKSQVNCITRKLLDAKGTRSVDSYHRELGKLMWEYCGMSRTARRAEIRALEDSRNARAVLEGR